MPKTTKTPKPSKTIGTSSPVSDATIKTYQRFAFDPLKHEYRLDGRVIPGVTEVIKDAGFELPFFGGRPEHGKMVHLATEFYDRGSLDWKTVAEEVFGYVQAWIQFRKVSGFVPLEIEQSGFSELGFAGTWDRTGDYDYHKQGKVLVDIKKFKPPLSLARLQLAGYDLIRGPFDQWQIVELKENGTFHLHVFDPSNLDRKRFLNLVDLYWYKRS